MNSEQMKQLRRLIARQPIAALGTLHDGAPYVSMAPFAALPDGSAIVVHVSQLTAHTKDMQADARMSLLIMDADDDADMPQARARVTIQGLATAAPAALWSACEEAYLDRFPDAAPIVGLGDFQFFLVRPTGARFVGGFAQAQSLSPALVTEALTTNPAV